MSLFARRVARFHKLLGLAVGLPLLFWTASGLFFTLYPIETIRGEHLRADPAFLDMSQASGVQVPELRPGALSLRLKQVLDRPVWEMKGEGWTVLLDSETLQTLPALDEKGAEAVARKAWAGQGEVVSVELVENPPRETFSEKPLWRVAFRGRDDAVFWVDGELADVVAVRTTRWRIFDVLWRFHILDVTGEDRFNTWWLRLFAFLALSTGLFGIALLVHRMANGRLFK